MNVEHVNTTKKAYSQQSAYGRTGVSDVSRVAGHVASELYCSAACLMRALLSF